jgi:hypothetical protein
MDTSFEYVGSCTRDGEMILPPEHRALVVIPTPPPREKNQEEDCRRQRCSAVNVDSLSKSYQQRKSHKSKIPQTIFVSTPDTELPSPSSVNTTLSPPPPPPPPPRPSQHSQPQAPQPRHVVFPQHIMEPEQEPKEKEVEAAQPQWLRSLSIKYCLDQSIRRFELLGLLSLFASVLINLPWILLIILVRENIQYDPETDVHR